MQTRRLRQVFELYVGGKDINEVMAESELSRGSVSGHLNDMEKNLQCAFIRGKVRGTASELLQDERGNGSRRASVRDFHSFRVTWITLALAAGVPLELVQRVTGHRTVAIVLKHYFRPGREDFRETIMSAMPELLTAPTGPKALTPHKRLKRLMAYYSRDANDSEREWVVVGGVRLRPLQRRFASPGHFGASVFARMLRRDETP
jgi:hypothetical protein